MMPFGLYFLIRDVRAGGKLSCFIPLPYITHERPKTQQQIQKNFWNEKQPSSILAGRLFLAFIRLIGIEPTHPAPEAGALSTELQAHILSYESFIIISQFQGRMQENFKILSICPKCPKIQIAAKVSFFPWIKGPVSSGKTGSSLMGGMPSIYFSH